jgi:hypothetical protein
MQRSTRSVRFDAKHSKRFARFDKKISKRALVNVLLLRRSLLAIKVLPDVTLEKKNRSIRLLNIIITVVVKI